MLTESELGQALLEAVVTISMCTMITLAVLFCSYLAFVKVASEFSLHEALVCRLTQVVYGPAPNCQEELRKQISRIVVFQKVEKIQWHQTRQSIQVQVQVSKIKMPFLQPIDLILAKSLSLPLSER